jgi:hypothetical protein
MVSNLSKMKVIYDLVQRGICSVITFVNNIFIYAINEL